MAFSRTSQKQVILTYQKRIPVLNLDEAGRKKVFEEIRLLSDMRCIYIVE